MLGSHRCCRRSPGWAWVFVSNLLELAVCYAAYSLGGRVRIPGFGVLIFECDEPLFVGLFK